MENSSQHTPDDHEGSMAKPNHHMLDMQSGFNTFEQTLKHHTALLNRQQEALDELKVSNRRKETIIEDLVATVKGHEATIAKMASAIQELEGKTSMNPQNNEQVHSVRLGAISERSQANAIAARSQLTQAQKHTIDKNLLQAASSGRLEDVQALLVKGADAESRHDGWTPFLTAAKNGHTEVVNVLLDWGASVDGRCTTQFTALMLASLGGHLDTVQVLIGRGAIIDLKDASERTAFITSCMYGHDQICKVLMAKGANINAQESEWGDTPLILASYNRHPTVVDSLVRSGANLNLRNKHGKTALYYARARENARAVRILEAAGAQG